MSDTDEKRNAANADDAPEDLAVHEAGEASAEDESQSLDAGPDSAADQPRDEVEELRAQAADLKDQLLRAMAETENLRRRSQREREDAVRYAPAALAKDMIEVADNLSRALEAVPAEAVEADEHLKNLMTGVGMTEKALQSAFEKHSIRRMDPMGERMDPHSHEAMFEVPDPSQPSGTIVQVIRAGYRLHDRLLRAAQVGVAKGGPARGAHGDDAKGTNGGERREPGSRVDTSA